MELPASTASVGWDDENDCVKITSWTYEKDKKENKMEITAESMRELAHNKNKSGMGNIFDLIKEASEEGKYNTDVSNLNNEQMQVLVSYGFQVRKLSPYAEEIYSIYW